MPTRKSNRENAMTIQKPGPENPDSKALTEQKKTEQDRLADEVLKTACQITGTRNLRVAAHLITQASGALVSPKPKEVMDNLAVGSAMMAEMEPRNALEAMLAAQMIAVNDAAHLSLSDATKSHEYASADQFLLRAARLLRIFTEQIEAMQRLKGKSCQQAVTVENVNVNQGGQAIVGAVAVGSAGREGDNGKNGGNTP